MATKKKSIDWQLAPAPESKDHFKLNEQYELFINGKWQKPKGGTRSAPLRNPCFDTINPANEHLSIDPFHVIGNQHR
ncbi:MAG: hypothetical protein IT230_06340 [Flavobacteriales bacterium]|nr:hypothetical protein [Flavobacteriales bacterium]